MGMASGRELGSVGRLSPPARAGRSQCEISRAGAGTVRGQAVVPVRCPSNLVHPSDLGAPNTDPPPCHVQVVFSLELSQPRRLSNVWAYLLRRQEGRAGLQLRDPPQTPWLQSYHYLHVRRTLQPLNLGPAGS